MRGIFMMEEQMYDFVDKMASAFQDELEKITKEKNAGIGAEVAKKTTNLLVPGLIAGSLGTVALQRAHKDWRMGRAMRMQNNSGY
jgi:hypothetical protein